MKTIGRALTNWNSRGFPLPLLVILLALMIRLPLYHTPYWRTDDTGEYLNVARNLALGRGLTQSVKFRLFQTDPVITSALKGRPVATAIALSFLLRIKNDAYFLQLGYLLLNALNAGLVYLLCRSFFSAKLSFFGGLLAAFNPNMFVNSRLILSEPLLIFWVLIAMVVFFRMREQAGKYFILGILAGLAYLTRLEGLFILPAFGWSLKRKPRYLFLLFLGFLLTALPFFYLNFRLNGNPLFTYNEIYFRVRSLQEALGGGFERPIPAIAEFVRQNYLWIISRLGINLINHLNSFMTFGYFGPLIFFVLYGFRRWQKFSPLLIFSFLTLGLYTLLWAAIFERERHFIVIYLLLLPLVLQFLKEFSRWPLPSVVSVLTLSVYLVLDIHRIFWARNTEPQIDIWNRLEKQEVYRWIDKHTAPSAIFATTNALQFNIFVDRPAILVPDNLSKDNFVRFIREYRVKYFLCEREKGYGFFRDRGRLVADFAGARIYCVSDCD